jgi:hypothetical protein
MWLEEREMFVTGAVREKAMPVRTGLRTTF